MADLDDLIARARKVTMTPAQEESQRRSFAYGNTKFENDHITRDMLDDAVEAVDAERKVT